MLAVSHDNIVSFRVMVDYRKVCMESDRAYYFGVFKQSTKEFIGEVMLYDVARGDVQTAVVGANISSPFRGMGYGSEAMRGLVRHAFTRLQLDRLEGFADPANYISIAMCERAGFRSEGLRVRRVKENGRWMDKIMLVTAKKGL